MRHNRSGTYTIADAAFGMVLSEELPLLCIEAFIRLSRYPLSRHVEEAVPLLQPTSEYLHIYAPRLVSLAIVMVHTCTLNNPVVKSHSGLCRPIDRKRLCHCYAVWTKTWINNV